MKPSEWLSKVSGEPPPEWDGIPVEGMVPEPEGPSPIPQKRPGKVGVELDDVDPAGIDGTEASTLADVTPPSDLVRYGGSLYEGAPDSVWRFVGVIMTSPTWLVQCTTPSCMAIAEKLHEATLLSLRSNVLTTATREGGTTRVNRRWSLGRCPRCDTVYFGIAAE